ncbi:flagellar filament capping protein FliD [uncultured Intestinimonas sp.]|uniref:flagellar filament capping protein FliD n=1 Tax=uncultured Intestinimonas sp. TaxID=1689265 RepID=UPI0025E9AEE3|nr:flagellar filament capping protein FliD [uncultured Intestinimonas sp.]
MASISSLMGGTSSSGSIYGSRNANIISGLASGLDTEAMIEGLVQSYQQKITGLEQDRTKLQWQQEAYQSISDKLVEFARKYTTYAYSSGTNLFSNSFFNNAVTTTTGGAFANLVSAAGKTSSSVTIDAVAQLATAAKYTVNNTRLGSLGSGAVTSGTVSLGDTTNVSTIEGSLTLTYGSKNLTVSFGELDLFNKPDGTLDTTALETAINEQLKAQQVTIGDNTYTGDQLFDVTVDSSGSLTLSDKLNAGNSPYISKASGDFAGLVTTDLSNASEDRPATVQLDMSKDVVKEMDTGDYLSGKTLSVTLNGQTKQISLDNIKAGAGQTFADAFKTELQNRLDTAFGSGKITVDLQGGKLSYTVASGSTFSISSSSAGSILGMEDGTLTSYLDTGKSLGSLLDENAWSNLTPVDQDSEGRDLYALTINGVEVGRYTRDTALETVINGINSSDAGVNVSYSNLTNQFVFTAKETGEGGRIEIANELSSGGTNQNLAVALFGEANSSSSGYDAGTDAVFRTTVNGASMTLTRSTNTFDVDGMSVTLSGTFNSAWSGSTPITSQDVANQVAAGTDAGYFDPNGEAVSFTSATDADTIVDAVKQMVTDYNAIMEEVKKAYTDMPLRKTNGDRYEPLTDEDRADMSEGAIKEYEEQAKTGILFMDSDISSLYNALRGAITPSGSDGSFLRSIGISTSYSDGLTTLTLDEDALRQALATNPDQVRDAFTKSEEGGASTDGLMASIQKVTDRYAATTGATKGILIEKAGSQYSPTSALNNTMLSKIQDVDDEIERWQGKLSDQVDFYTNKFTQLEMLINQMNSQSSALAGLMGGY